MNFAATTLIGVLGLGSVAASAWSGFWPWSVPPAAVAGHADVIDGDTIRVGGDRVRLEGIDAPETDQKCKDASGCDYLCGIVASRAMRSLIGQDPVNCRSIGKDRYGRVLGVCTSASGTDISAELVRRGLAVAFRRYSMRYAQVEDAARAAGAGLWAGTFEHPGCFRAARDRRPCNDKLAS